MKKITTITALTVLALATGVSAEVTTQFRWYNTTANNLLNNSSSAIAAGNATILTYLSSDNTINFDSGVLLQESYGNDFYYAALGNTLAGRLTSLYMTEDTANVGWAEYAGYYAYAVILDMPVATFNGTYGGNVANVPVGTYYDITSIFGGLTDMNPGGPAPTPDSFNAGNLQTSTQVIPEPATFALFGIGGIGAWMVRRSKKAKLDA